MEKLEQIKKQIQDYQNKSAVTQDLKAFLTLVLGYIKVAKDDFSSISKDNLATLQETLKYLETEHENILSNVKRETTQTKEQFIQSVKEIKDLIAKIQTIKPIDGIDGYTPVKGEDYFTEKELKGIKDEVLKETLKNIPKLDDTKIVDEVKKKLKKEKYISQEDLDRALSILDQRTSFLLQKPSSTGGGISNITGYIEAGTNVTFGGSGTLADPYVVNSSSGGGGAWGTITGTLSDQTDLQDALDLKAPLTSPTFATSITGSYLTASEILITDASKNIVSAPVATYPSLTEISYVKGVSSAIQTQLNAKFTLPSLTTGSVLFSNGTTIAQDNANFFWDDTNNRLGIGTNTPTTTVELNAGATAFPFKLTGASSDRIALVINNNSNGDPFIGFSTSDVGKWAVGFENTGDFDFKIRSNAFSMEEIYGTTRFVIKNTTGNVGIGITTPSAKFHALATTEQLRLGYDASNYLSTTINSTGSATFNLTGTSPEFTFSDPVNVPDEAYGAGWNGNTEVPTKNAVYDKIESLGGGGTVTSVAMSVPTGLTITGSPVTTTGTLAVALDTGYVIPLQSTLDAKAPLTSPTFQTSINGAYLTASEILITDASKNIVSAPVATYPSLTELTYVKGVTSAIQTQLNGKQSTITFGTGVQTALGVNIGSAGAPVLFNGALGTPSSGTLTNATGLPIAGLVASTSTAIGVGSIELGHASDTTIARVSAGVASIEGFNIVTLNNATFSGNQTQTLVVNTRYFLSTSLYETQTMTLPATFAVGDVIELFLAPIGSTINIVLASGDSYLYLDGSGNEQSTTNSIAQTTPVKVRLVCSVANTSWKVTDIIGGNLAINSTTISAIGGSLQTGSGDLVYTAATQTLSAKRINPIIASTATGDISPSIATADIYIRTNLAGTTAINAPTGSPLDGNQLIFRLRSTGVRTLNWNATYVIIGTAALPTATVANKLIYVRCIYNSVQGQWDVVQVNVEA